MKEYLVRWNAGYGDDFYVVDAKNEIDAEKEAYALWFDDIASSADYEVIGEVTDALLEEYGMGE
jgi:hypothetical protein